MSEGVFVYDGEGRVVTWNPSAQRILGFSRADVQGKSLEESRLPAIRGDGTPFEVGEFPPEITLATGEPISDVLMGLTLGTGRFIWISVSTRPLIHEGERRPYAVVSTIAEVTTQHAMEQRLLEAKEAAEAASLAKSDFLARMSHELRTPLNSVIGFASILSKNKRDNLTSDDLAYVSRINTNGRHLLSLINDLLDLSKIESGRMELDISDGDVSTVVRSIADEFEEQFRVRGVALLVDVPVAPVIVMTDTRKLTQVLYNLVSNALKFTEQGSVTISVIAWPTSSCSLDILVRDTGVGIPPNRIDAVFSPFEQADSSTSRKYGGTGLGLAISRSLCELIGATLTAESELGRGSTFRISFFE